MLGLAQFLNLMAFVGLSSATYLIFYYSLIMNPKSQISTKIFILSLGINFIGLSHLFRLFGEAAEIFILFTLALGTIFTFFGIATVFYEKGIELASLRKRHKELEEMISNLKEKYYKQEISEEELKSVHASLLRELAELEVRLKTEAKEESGLLEKFLQLLKFRK